MYVGLDGRRLFGRLRAFALSQRTHQSAGFIGVYIGRGLSLFRCHDARPLDQYRRDVRHFHGDDIEPAGGDGVVDFLDFYLGSFHWPVFNLADIGITTGTALIILHLWRNR